MSVLHRMTVSQRLATGFGFLTFLLLAVCALGSYNARQAQNMVSTQIADVQQRLDLSAMLVELQLTRGVHLRQVGLLTDPSEMQKQAKLVRDAGKQIGATLAQMGRLNSTEEERSLLEDVRKLDTQYQPASEKALGMALGTR